MSPTHFNVLVDVVVWKSLKDVMDNITAAIAGLQGDNVSRMSSLFYANNDVIESFDYEWLQNATHYLCNLFRDCTGLKSNTEKTESMSCHSGAIRGRYSMEGYKRRHEGTGETYSKRKGKRTVCPVPSCGKDLTLGSLQSHLRTKHGMYTSGSIITKPVALAPLLYKLSFIHQSGHSQHKVPCLQGEMCIALVQKLVCTGSEQIK